MMVERARAGSHRGMCESPGLRVVFWSPKCVTQARVGDAPQRTETVDASKGRGCALQDLQPVITHSPGFLNHSEKCVTQARVGDAP